MMSAEVIKDFQRQAARRASKDKLHPYIVWPGDQARWMAELEAGTLRLPFPNLGTYRPKGWKPTGRTLFVDKSGMGREDEPALTVRGMIEELTVDKAYAIIEEGQFQVYLGEFDSPYTKQKGGQDGRVTESGRDDHAG